MFGSIKSTDTEGIRRGFTRYRGQAMLTLAFNFAAVIANVRHQGKYWQDHLDAPAHPAADRRPGIRRHRLPTHAEAARLDQLHEPEQGAA